MNLKIQKWRAEEKNTRRGYCEIFLPDIGLTIRDVVVHRFDSPGGELKVWLSLPAREYTNRAGERKWWPLVFFDRTFNDPMQDEARKQLRNLAPKLFAPLEAA